MITGLNEEEYKEVCRILKDYSQDYFFYFYGSRVKGNFAKFSDLDVYVVAHESMENGGDYGILDTLQDIFDDNLKVLCKVNFTRDDYIKDDFRQRIRSYAIPYDWQTAKLGDVADINKRYSLQKQNSYKFLEMKKLPEFERTVNDIDNKIYTSGGMKFTNQDTIMARITPCLENGKGAYVNFLKDKEIAFGSTEYIILSKKDKISNSKFIYYLSRDINFRDYAITNMIGTSGRQRVSKDIIKDGS